ncbi:Rossmann-like domain-containing protein [Corynebacterium atypicum]|uniref:Rossmann-like domain-containing protein n=1 Tax=Corynebacterium atypicum TaxID=191610 RepID=UPI00068E3833|nr:DUF364 domain-containing protein [Corynebacterium atypicum]
MGRGTGAVHSPNPWALYEELASGIPADLTVVDYQVAGRWAWVKSSSGQVGMAGVYRESGRPVSYSGSAGLFGMPLSEAAGLARSWNFTEAGIGVAAMNACYNAPERGGQVGVDVADLSQGRRARVLGVSRGDSFRVFRERVAGKKVAVVGHFKGLEQVLNPVCDLSILERAPMDGDFPDSAAEYLPPRSDWVFITGSALVNKTLPRLLELSRDAMTAVVGPFTPMTELLFDYGADVLSGFLPQDSEGLCVSLRGIGGGRKYNFGTQVNRARA